MANETNNFSNFGEVSETVKVPFALSDFVNQQDASVTIDNNGDYTITLNNGSSYTINMVEGRDPETMVLELSDGRAISFTSFTNIVNEGIADNTIDQPASNTAEIIYIEDEENYLFDITQDSLTAVDRGNGHVLINFENGGQVLLINYKVADNPGFTFNGESLDGFDGLIAALQDSVVDDLDAEFSVADRSPNAFDEFDAGALNDIVTAAGDTTPSEPIEAAPAKPQNTQISTSAETDRLNAESLNSIETAAGEDTGSDLAQIEPAAGPQGPQSAGGFGFNSSVNNTNIQQLNATGPLGATQLGFGGDANGIDQALPDILNAAPTVTPPPSAPILSVTDASVLEDGSVVMPVNASPDATDGSETITVVISNIPNNVSVNTSQSGGVYDSNAGTWTVTLAPGDSLNNGPIITPPANSDVDITNLVVTVTTTQSPSGLTSSTSDSFDIIVDAVADQPTFSVNQNVQGNEDTAIPLTITLNLNDQDGSETGQVLITGLPAGGTLSAGTFDNNLGGYILTPAELNGLTFTPPTNLSGIISMTATAIVTENPTDQETNLLNNEVQESQDFTVTVNPIADKPVVQVQDTSVLEDGSVPLQIDVQLTDNDSSENLTIRVEGFPAGSTVDVSQSGGSYNPNTGVWELTLAAGQNFSGGPTVTPPANSDVDFSLTVTATSTEIGNLSQTATVTTPLNVTVDAVADQPTLTASASDSGTANVIDLNIATAVTDTDGSESIREIRLSGFPAGTTLNAGTENNGVFTLTVNDLNGLQATVPNGSNGSFPITVEVDVVDTPTDAETNIFNNVETRSLSFGLNLQDDMPNLTFDGDISADESAGLDTAPKVFNGQIQVDFGNDGPGSFATNGTVPTGLTSLGDAVNVVQTNATTYTGTANGRPVFTFVINPATGAYTFTLQDSLDHPDGLNPNDVLGLGFGITATDDDGDTLDITTTVSVVDDAPTAVNDSFVRNANTGTVNGNLLNNDDIGFDAPGSVSEITFNNVTQSVPAAGLTIVGDFGTLVVQQDGSYTYTLDANRTTGGQDVFSYTAVDADGDSATATLTATVGDVDDFPVITPPSVANVDESTAPRTATGQINVDFGRDAPGTITESDNFDTSLPQGTQLTSNGVPVVVNVVNGQYVGTANGQPVFTMDIQTDGSYSFELLDQLDHSNPTDPGDTLDLRFGFRAQDDDGDATLGTVVIRVADDAPEAVDDSLTVQESGNSTSGNILTNDDSGFDADATVTQVRIGNTTVNVPTTGTATVNGTFGTLVIGANGAYTYTSGNAEGVDNFVYTIADADGDTDTATLQATVTDRDDQPRITDLGGNGGLHNVDEAGVKTASGTVTADVGDDGPATFTESNAFFASVAILESKGEQISVNLVNGQYVGTAGGREVFTFNLNANGTYNFVLKDQIDHPGNGTDTVDLRFGVQVSDSDNDSVSDFVTIRVQDDVPNAVNDVMAIAEGSTKTGNVFANDDVGFDEAGRVITTVKLGGNVVNIPSGQTVQIQGDYGTLTISSDGSYSYVSTVDINATVWEKFDYTIQDQDGDTDTARLQFDIQAADDNPDITSTGGTRTVDETNVLTTSGQVTADFGSDAAGSFFTEHGTFSSSVGSLTSNGQAVTVSVQNGKYVGKVGNNTIFELNINANGSYTFQQFDQLDHPNSGNHNDFLDLRFGVRAVDGDGDIDTANIVIRVRDDGPNAVNDVKGMNEGQTKTGNVITNDDKGFDDAGARISKIQIGNNIHNIAEGGSVTINGSYGQLTIHSNGNYSYKSTANINNTVWEKFTYTLADGDNDVDTAMLQFDIKAAANDVSNVQGNLGNASFYEGDANFKTLPITASYSGGDGNETVTLKISGVPAGWAVSAPGWSKSGNVYTKTVTGKNITDNTFKVRPPQNDSDVDGKFRLDVTVNDPNGPNGSDADYGTAIVDAVVDGVHIDILTANEYQALQSGSAPTSNNYNTTYNNYYNTYYGGVNNGANSTTNYYQNLQSTRGEDLWQNSYDGRGSGYGNNFYYNGNTYVPTGTGGSGGSTYTYSGSTNTGSSSTSTNSAYSGYAANNSYGYNTSTWLSFAWGNMNLSRDVVKIDLKDTDGSESITKIIISGLYSGGREIGFNVGTKLAAGKWQLTYDQYLQAQFVDVSGNATSATYSGSSGFLNGTIYNNFRVDVYVRDNATDQEITTSNNNTVATVSQELRVYSPLVLDLDGDSVELEAIENGVLFDLDGDGDLEQTGWVNPDDGLLAIDNNGDGMINDGTELFGEATAEHGFAALAELDSNLDGVIDANDARFGELLVWRDYNMDGVSQADELVTLSDLGIASISLGYTEDFYAVDGNFIGYESTYQYEDGTVRDIADVYFNVDDGESVYSSETSLIITDGQESPNYDEYATTQPIQAEDYPVPVLKEDNSGDYDEYATTQPIQPEDYPVPVAESEVLENGEGAEELEELIELGSIANLEDLDLGEGDVLDFSDVISQEDFDAQDLIEQFIEQTSQEEGVGTVSSDVSGTLASVVNYEQALNEHNNNNQESF